MSEKGAADLAKQIMDFYNEYDLRVSGKIQDHTAFQLIEELEQRFDTDSICLSDGTRIWNLLRVFLYSNYQSLEAQMGQKKGAATQLSSLLSLLKDSLRPLHLPHTGMICGFSSGESRKLYNDTYYDIYLDPLYEVLGDQLAVFEWPQTTGEHRTYDKPVFSKHYVPMHIPFFSTTFWNLVLHQVTGRRAYTLQGADVLTDIITFIGTSTSIPAQALQKDIDDFLTVFFEIKRLLSSILKKIQPKAVLIRCGYGRFPMALSQACRQLHIPSIELQHGLITSYLPAYRRTTPTTNKDCIPEYLLTHGEIYADLVRSGNIFDKENVVSTGYPYLQKILQERKTPTKKIQDISPFHYNILFTSQWIVASQIKEFVTTVADTLKEQHMDVGILFKPHPYDKNDYSELQKHPHIILIEKYEDTFQLFTIADIHSTVYSTSGLEAMAFDVPNIFVDISHMTSSGNTPYIVDTPAQFVASINTMLSNYKETVVQTKAVAVLFFTPHPEKHFTQFFSTHQLL